MKIEVTQEDIQQGVCDDPHNCPVARAIRRIHPRDPINVDTNEIHIGGTRYTTPDCAEEFICNFDQGNGGQPFSFEL